MVVVVADSASFGNIYNVKSDSVGIGFSFKKLDSYGKLIFAVKNCKTNAIIQLLNNSEKLVTEASLKSDGKVVFPMLDNGTYRARVIYDLNGDGKWTTGNFDTGRQPEPVSYFPHEIELKSGWEEEEDWDIEKEWVKPERMKQKQTSKSNSR